MKRLIAFILCLTVSSTAFCQVFKNMKYGGEFGMAVAKDGGSPSLVLQIQTAIKTMIQLEQSGEYGAAAEFGRTLCNKFIEIGNHTQKTYYFIFILEHTANNYHAVGAGSQSIYYGKEVLRLLENKVGTNHEEYLTALINLATYYSDLPDYFHARELIDKGLQLAQNKKKFRKYWLHLQNTNAILLSNAGNKDEAIEIMKTIIAEEPDNISYRTNYISIMYSAGSTKEIVETQRKLTDDVALKYGTDSYAYADQLNRLAFFVYKETGDAESAIEYAKQCEEIYKSHKNTLNKNFASTLTNIASFYFHIGNYATAVEYAERADNILSRILSPSSPSGISVKKSLALYYSRIGDYDKCAEQIAMFKPFYDGNIRATMMMSREERENIWHDNAVWFTDILPMLALKSDNSYLARAAYDGALLSKGLLLNTEIALSEYANEAGGDVKKAYDEWQAAKLEMTKPKPEFDSEAQLADIKRKEEAFIRLCIPATQQMKRLSVNFEEVRNSLPESSASVEFVKTTLGECESVVYAALLLKKEYEYPKVIPLHDGLRIENWKSESWDRLFNLIWQPMADELSGIENVYFSPIGELYNIPVESLSEMFASEHRLYRLSSTRELVTNESVNKFKNAVLYGGIEYETDTETLIEESKIYPVKRDISHTITVDSLNVRAGVAYLPGTLAEVNNINKSLDDASVHHTLLVDIHATEESFKYLSGSQIDMLHIATHGFYWPESELQSADNFSFLMTDNDLAAVHYTEDKALTRSGLLFSGANNVLRGFAVPEGVDDGILTAHEISQLDLRGLDLVVMSACQTGLGEITGDGVFGLQRGFKKAGANTLMMSLWSVDDNATRLLMSRFYRNLIEGKSKYESLHDAQNYLKKYGSGEYNNPIYWAAFILLDGLN